MHITAWEQVRWATNCKNVNTVCEHVWRNALRKWLRPDSLTLSISAKLFVVFMKIVYIRLGFAGINNL